MNTHIQATPYPEVTAPRTMRWTQAAPGDNCGMVPLWASSLRGYRVTAENHYGTFSASVFSRHDNQECYGYGTTRKAAAVAAVQRAAEWDWLRSDMTIHEARAWAAA